jgi:hypothetical protein
MELSLDSFGSSASELLKILLIPN